jgi:hypothetical protein
MRHVFTTVHVKFFGFATLVAVPLRDTRLGEGVEAIAAKFRRDCVSYTLFAIFELV